MNVLRDGGLHHVFAEVRAPSTLGSFLRAFCHGNVRQLDAVHRRLLAGLAARAPLLPGKDVLAYLDIDACQRRVYGVTKQGAAFGAAKIHGKVDQHPGDEAADLQRRARGLGAGDADGAGREAVQPGRISEPHRRLHAGGREQIFVVEHQMRLLGRVPEIHLPSALSTWGIEALSTCIIPGQRVLS